MSIVSSKDFNPRPSEITLKGKAYILKPFATVASIWAEDKFSTKEKPQGLQNLSELLSKFGPVESTNAMCEVIFYLLKDKSDFKNSDHLLVQMFKDGKNQKMMDCYNALHECIGNAQPHFDEIENELEAKKLKAVGN